MTLCNSGTLEAIAPEIRALTIQTVSYFVLASVAAREESRYGEDRRFAGNAGRDH